LTRISFAGGEKGIEGFLAEKGHLPLPPYIKRSKDVSTSPLDKERYQTVYADRLGAVAAPTAGLHFTDDLLLALGKEGIPVAPLTLHVGYGTFRPVEAEDIRRHHLEEEFYVIEPSTAKRINETKAAWWKGYCRRNNRGPCAGDRMGFKTRGKRGARKDRTSDYARI
jgi:S-adenosylmethionine:tRNA ribosyltransferase-isomerase